MADHPVAARAHIATLIDVTFPSTPPVAQPAKQENSRGVKIGAAIIVAVVAIACIGGITALVNSIGSSSDSPSADHSIEAKVACEGFVKDKLKAPSTAKFSDESTAKMSDSEYTAAGSVDSQNSFGASLRNTFACDVTTDGHDNWTAKVVSVTNN